jgi:FtsZ-binding cell division protein ZapB
MSSTAVRKNTVTINDKTYDFESLNDKARKQIDNIRVVDMEIGRLKAQLAIAQTARAAYAQTLENNLPIGD